MLKSYGIAAILILLNSTVHAQVDVANVAQLHIRLKSHAQGAAKTLLSSNETGKLSTAAGVILTPDSVTPDNAHVVHLPRTMTRAEAWSIAAKLATHPDVDHIEPIDPEFNKRPPNIPPALH